MKNKETQIEGEVGCYIGSAGSQKIKRRDTAYKRASIATGKRGSARLFQLLPEP